MRTSNKSRYRSIQTLSPILKHAKVLLLVMSGLLLLANLYVLTKTREHAQSYSQQQNQATWFLFQLTKEFSELRAITQYATQNDAHRKQVQLKYDLTWSRFDLLITSKESDTFIAVPGAQTFFIDLFDQFKALEYMISHFEKDENSDLLSSEVDKLYMSMIHYVNTNFRIKSPLYQYQMEQARNLHIVQFALLILMLICGGLAASILHKESEYHKVQSLTDSLTGIANRLAMFQALKDNVLNNSPFTLYLLDLNGFKEINDRYGHQAGDQVLKTFAKRLRSISATCYRIGGDEFAMLVSNEQPHAEADLIGEVRSMMSQPIEITHSKKQSINILAATSIGLAQYPRDSQDTNELLLIADSRMYTEKHSLRAVSNK